MLGGYFKKKILLWNAVWNSFSSNYPIYGLHMNKILDGYFCKIDWGGTTNIYLDTAVHLQSLMVYGATKIFISTQKQNKRIHLENMKFYT